MIWISPDMRLSVAPALETTPPSRTVMVDVALLPSTSAVMTAGPGATPVTVPDDDTVALATSELVQENVRDKTCPDWSLAVALSWKVAAGTKVAVAADSVTLAVTGGGGGGGPVASPPHDPINQPRAIAAIGR